MNARIFAVMGGLQNEDCLWGWKLLVLQMCVLFCNGLGDEKFFRQSIENREFIWYNSCVWGWKAIYRKVHIPVKISAYNKLRFLVIFCSIAEGRQRLFHTLSPPRCPPSDAGGYCYARSLPQRTVLAGQYHWGRSPSSPCPGKYPAPQCRSSSPWWESVTDFRSPHSSVPAGRCSYCRVNRPALVFSPAFCTLDGWNLSRIACLWRCFDPGRAIFCVKNTKRMMAEGCNVNSILSIRMRFRFSAFLVYANKLVRRNSPVLNSNCGTYLLLILKK